MLGLDDLDQRRTGGPLQHQAGEVLAFTLGIRGLGNYCSDQLGFGCDDEAVASLDTLGSGFGRLVYR